MHFDHSLLVSKQNKHHLQSVSAESHTLNCSRCVHHLCQENVHRIHVKTPRAPFLCKPVAQLRHCVRGRRRCINHRAPGAAERQLQQPRWKKKVQFLNTCPFGEQMLAFQAMAERCQALRAPSSSPGTSTSVREMLLIAGRGAARWKNKEMP